MMAYGSSLEQGLARALNLLDFVVWETGRRCGKIATLELHDLRSADHPVPFGAWPIPVEYVGVREAVRPAPPQFLEDLAGGWADGARHRAPRPSRWRHKDRIRASSCEGD